MILCELQQPVRIIFELTRLDRVFDIYPTEAAALQAMN
jgi:anti-sigma B factor antagonist